MVSGKLLRKAAKTAIVATAATSAAILLTSKRDTGSSWAGFNSICHMVDGDDRATGADFHLRDTLLGAGLNASAIATWSIIYEAVLGGVPLPSSAFWAALATAGIWAVDYRMVPKRFTPGFENRISKLSIAVVYAALATSFALTPLWNKMRPSNGDS